jgi:hypothetical protein
MKTRLIALAFAGATLLAARSTSARNDRLTFNIKTALGHGDAIQKLDPNLKLFFGKEKHPAVGHDLGDFTVKEKTRALRRTNQAACDWVFLSAVLGLEKRAHNMQANAIIDIQSSYDNQPFVSDTETRAPRAA